jgi:acetyl esterase
MAARRIAPLHARVRQRAGRALVDNFFRGMSAVGRLHPDARPERHGVERLADVPYLPSQRPEHRLDIYRPVDATGPLPVVFYVHGGSFRILSKETHWVMALAFARRGYLVFNVDYRLAPRHPFPAAHADVMAAWQWVLDHAQAYGGDLGSVVVAGESAGANLAMSLTLAACMRRPEPWARAVFERGHLPAAVVPACGIFQVSDTARFARRRRPVSRFILDRLTEITDTYLGEAQGHELADPLLILENGAPLERPLPPLFLPVGTRDPLVDDTRRMEAALSALGASCETRYYSGELHAFHAFLWRPNARQCWKDTYAFLDRALPGSRDPARGTAEISGFLELPLASRWARARDPHPGPGAE